MVVLMPAPAGLVAEEATGAAEEEAEPAGLLVEWTAAEAEPEAVGAPDAPDAPAAPAPPDAPGAPDAPPPAPPSHIPLKRASDESADACAIPFLTAQAKHASTSLHLLHMDIHVPMSPEWQPPYAVIMVSQSALHASGSMLMKPCLGSRVADAAASGRARTRGRIKRMAREGRDGGGGKRKNEIEHLLSDSGLGYRPTKIAEVPRWACRPLVVEECTWAAADGGGEGRG